MIQKHSDFTAKIITLKYKVT